MTKRQRGERDLGLELARAIPQTASEPFDHDGRARIRPRRSARILVVDDETHVRAMMGSTLERQGYEVQLASSGREAIETLELKI